MRKIANMRLDWKNIAMPKIISCIFVFLFVFNLDCSKSEDTPLSTALQIAQSTQDKRERAVLLQHIIIYIAYHGEYDSALYLVSTIDDTLQRNRSFYHIVSAYLDNGYHDEAIQLVDSIKTVGEKSSVLDAIAIRYAKTDSIDQAIMFLKQSYATARTIEDCQDRAQQLAFIASSYQFIKHENQALMILSEAVETIDMASDTNWFKINTMVYIAGKYTEIGKKDAAKSLLRRAHYLAETIAPDHFRDLRMADIVQKYATMGMFSTALEIANSINGVEQKERALASIAVSYANGGRTQEARQIAENIERPYPSGEAMKAIANKYIENGNDNKARNVVQGIKNPAARVDGFCWLTHKYLKMEQFDRAIKSLKEAQTIIASAEDDFWKSSVLVTIADLYVKLEQPDTAMDFLLQSWSVANTLEDDHEKSLCLFQVARSLAEINQLHLALETTAMIISPYLKISALLHIQEKYVEAGKKPDKKTKQILREMVDDIGKESMKPNKN